MSTKSQQPHQGPPAFSAKMRMAAVIILIVFLTIIIVYPRIFSPSHIGRDTGPAPVPAAEPSATPVK